MNTKSKLAVLRSAHWKVGGRFATMKQFNAMYETDFATMDAVTFARAMDLIEPYPMKVEAKNVRQNDGRCACSDVSRCHNRNNRNGRKD